MLFCNYLILQKMIYFIGFMGVGKTSIGMQFALQHNMNFIDTDKKIEITTNKSISDIFQKDGEDYFRNIETKILKMIPKKNIVSCGGGLPVYNNNMCFIKKSGVSIYLKASENAIFNRLSRNHKNRPLIQDKAGKDLRNFITEKLIEREKFYLMADYTIDINNLSKETILRKINSLPIFI